MYGIEKSLDVDLALAAVRVGIYLDEAAGLLLRVEAFGMQTGAVVEIKLA